MSKKITVGMIYGGKSGEHEVSLQTAKAVIDAFDFDKYDIVPFYITKEGQWRCGKLLQAPVESVQQLMHDTSAIEQSNPLLPILQRMNGEQRIDIRSEAQSALPTIDIAFPLLHGTYGEDGTIQGLFEMAGIPYVGAGVLASAVGMDKVMMKKIFAHEGLPQAIYRYFNRKEWEQNSAYHIMEIEIALGYPCFVKPANLGSSVGISKAQNRDELIEAVNEAFLYDRKVVVEEFVEAREIEVSVLGNDEPKASVPGEILSSNDFYDYRAKYIDGKSAMIIPAELPASIVERIREMALQAFQAIDGSGLARVDFFLRKSDQAILINEINTMPGFTPFSMYPLLWKETGLSYKELLDKLIELGLERYNERQQIRYGIELDPR